MVYTLVFLLIFSDISIDAHIGLKLYKRSNVKGSISCDYVDFRDLSQKVLLEPLQFQVDMTKIALLPKVPRGPLIDTRKNNDHQMSLSIDTSPVEINFSQ